MIDWWTMGRSDFVYSFCFYNLWSSVIEIDVWLSSAENDQKLGPDVYNLRVLVEVSWGY